MASDGRMRDWLMGLDEWLLREDPDVCAGAAEELASYDDTDDDTPEGDAQDAEYDAHDDHDDSTFVPAATAH